MFYFDKLGKVKMFNHRGLVDKYDTCPLDNSMRPLQLILLGLQYGKCTYSMVTIIKNCLGSLKQNLGVFPWVLGW